MLQKPRRFRDILDRVAMDEAKTLRAIGGERLAGAFLRAYAAAEPMEILEGEAGFAVRIGARGRLAAFKDAPSIATEEMAAIESGREARGGHGRKNPRSNYAESELDFWRG